MVRSVPGSVAESLSVTAILKQWRQVVIRAFKFGGVLVLDFSTFLTIFYLSAVFLVMS